MDKRLHGNLLLLGCVLLSALIVGFSQLHCRDLAYSEDEAGHTVTGLYFADLAIDRPHHLVDYTYRYYAQYPALGLIHWPPFFYAVEGGMFLIAGRSLEVARLTVLLFLLMGLTFWFKLVRTLLGPTAAAFSTLLLAFTPSVFYFTHAVMLGVPALALSLAAAYFWIRCLQTGNRNLLYAVAVFSALAMLVAPHAAFLLPFCLFTWLAERKWSLLFHWTAVKAFAVSAVLLIPYYAAVMKVHGGTVAAEVVQRGSYRWIDFNFYLKVLPGELGWPMLLMAIAGAIMFFFERTRRPALWMALWIVACYVTLTFVNSRDARYAFGMLPPLIFFAGWPLAIARGPRSWGAGLALCGLFLATYAYAGMTGQYREVTGAYYRAYPQLSGYSAAAKRLLETSVKPEVVLVDDLGDFSGNLIFYLRAYDPQRRFVVLTKGLYVTNVSRSWGARELVHTTDDLRQLLAAYGIQHIVVSDDQKYEFPIQGILREFLKGPQFRLVARIPVTSNPVGMRKNDLLLYENLQATAPTSKDLDLKMLTLGHDIVVPLADYGIR